MKQFEVGQTVYSKATGKAFIIKRISASGRLAFGAPPYNSGSYRHDTYTFTADRMEAMKAALATYTSNLRYYERAVNEAQAKLAEANDAIHSLAEAIAEAACGLAISATDLAPLESYEGLDQ